MVWYDILLKLLPFTSSNGHTTYFTLWDLTLGDIIITIITLLLLGIFLRYWLKLSSATKKDKKKIDNFIEKLKEYKNNGNYNDFKSSLEESDGELYKIWNEFDESLVYQNETDTYLNTIDAEYFFNKKTLLTHLGTKFYSTIPSILLGIGLIGTFLGLFVGLVQLDMNNADTLKESMKALIHAAGVKFVASIWGLGLSLLFTIIEKSKENKLEKKIDEIQKIIDTTFKRVISEQSLEEIKDESKQQTIALNGMATSITEQLTSEFKGLGNHISSAIVESFREPLDKIANSVTNASSGQTQQTGEMMEALINRFIDTINQKVGSQIDTFKQNMDETRELMTGISESLASFKELSQDTFNKQNETNKERDESLMSLIKDMQQTHSNITAENTNSTSNLLTRFDESVHNVKTNMDEILTGIETKASRIEDVIQAISMRLLSVPGFLNQFEKSANSLKEFAQKTDEGAKNLSDASGKILKAGNTMTTFSAEVKNSGEIFKQINNDSKNTYQDLANQYKDLLETNEESMKGFESQLNEYKTSMASGVRDTFAKFDGELGKFAASLSSAVGELNDSIEELAEKTASIK